MKKKIHETKRINREKIKIYMWGPNFSPTIIALCGIKLI